MKTSRLFRGFVAVLLVASLSLNGWMAYEKEVLKKTPSLLVKNKKTGDVYIKTPLNPDWEMVAGMCLPEQYF